MKYNGNLKETWESMTSKDKEYAQNNDFEGMKDEIDKILQKFVDDIYFAHVNDKKSKKYKSEIPIQVDYENIAIIDATMTTIHAIASSGAKLIKERHEKEMIKWMIKN